MKTDKNMPELKQHRQKLPETV